MGSLEQSWRCSLSRREALLRLAGLLAGSPLLHGQPDPRPASEHRRTPGIGEMLDAFDFEPVFFSNLPLAVSNYTALGDGSEWTVDRNRQAFDWLEIVPGRPIDPDSIDLSRELLGLKLKYPVLIAPTANQQPLHPDAESGMYRGATEAARTPLCLSGASSHSPEQVAQAAAGQLWWQFFPRESLDVSRELLDRAREAGAGAIVMTVDQQAAFYERSQRDRNLGGRPRPTIARSASRADPPPKGPRRYGVNPGRLWYTWSYLDEVRKLVNLPLLVKGVLDAADAARCVEHGVDGIIVSNHGGRSMDYSPSTLEVLPEIAAAVGGRIPVLIDSGFRRGSDILKALALGADAVLLGRAPRWGLGAYGPAGVQRLLEILHLELVEAAAAAGRPTLASIDSSLVRTSWP